jgi:dihydroxy-acid dehydratase
VELVAEGLRPRQILTPGAFRNAVAAVLAISGSVNCVKHLQAVAVEAGCDVDVLALFEELAPQVPLLTGVKPTATGGSTSSRPPAALRRCSTSCGRCSTSSS